MDMQHPDQHPFLATIPISIMLLAGLGVSMFWNVSENLNTGLRVVWAVGSLLEIAATLWVTARWLQAKEAGGPSWNAITPVLFIPVVGNALAPLAGLTIELEPWAMAQFGLGLFLWPVMQALLVVRWVHVGPLPPRMVPALFIMVVPLYRRLRPLAHGSGTALGLVRVGCCSLLFSVGPDANQYPAQLALWHAALGHELSDGSFHHPHLAISLCSQLRVAGFT